MGSKSVTAKTEPRSRRSRPRIAGRGATHPTTTRLAQATQIWFNAGDLTGVEAMGDRFDRKGGRMARGLAHLRGKPPPQIIAWGLGETAGIGHNNGPPLEDETPGYLWRRYRWKKAHAEAWRNPSMGILKLRVARAEAAGVSYEAYVSELLDTGRYLQASDVRKRRGEPSK